MNRSRGPGFFVPELCAGIVLLAATVGAAGLEPGSVTTIEFPDDDLSPSLYEMMTGVAAPPTLAYRLPDDYDPGRLYPLLVYVPGNHGGPRGNIGNALAIAGPSDWVVASLPLFKRSVDRDEVGGGLLVGFDDYPTISRAYRTLFEGLDAAVPNIDPERSAMVGFSNGALTIAVLVSSNDEFVLSHFQSFCLVDNGMFHLTDLHKKKSRDARYLVLSGDDPRDMGRDLRIRGGQLLEDALRLLGVVLSFHVMRDTGHEFEKPQMELVGRWLRGEALSEPTPAVE